jgi:hypothetical protein
MNVSLQLTQTAHSANAGKSLMLRDIDMDTALAISTALRELPQAHLDAVILVENLSTTAPALHKPKLARTGRLSGWLRGFTGPALVR